MVANDFQPAPKVRFLQNADKEFPQIPPRHRNLSRVGIQKLAIQMRSSNSEEGFVDQAEVVNGVKVGNLFVSWNTAVFSNMRKAADDLIPSFDGQRGSHDSRSQMDPQTV